MFFKSKSGGAQWAIVFLGNPGKQYNNSRHNVGFMTADRIEAREKIKINRLRFNALTATGVFGGEKVIFIKPQTYMNLSGNAVAPAAAFYNIAPERVIVVCDDISLPVGKLRIRTKGSSGGHNGLKSIISALGTENLPRIKIGVGAPPANSGEEDIINWVLGSFCKKDAELIDSALERAVEALSEYISEGADKAMNKYN